MMLTEILGLFLSEKAIICTNKEGHDIQNLLNVRALE